MIKSQISWMSRRSIALLIGISATLLAGLAGGSASAAEALRLGWQVPWATQGQLVMGLKHTNIRDLVGLDLEFIGFSYGGPLNSAAIAGEVDVLLTADQPALVLISKDSGFRIVARMMYNRACVYVPVQSPIAGLEDLTGRSVSGPVGAAAERIMLAALREAGVDLDSVRFGVLDMAQQAALLRRAGTAATGWEGTAALYGFDPLPAIFEEAGLARMLHCGKIVSVVVASDQALEQRREDVERFLAGFALSWLYFARNPEEVNRWFSVDSRLNVSNAVLDKVAAVEPNRAAASLADVRLDFSDVDLHTLAQVAEFLLERDLIRKLVDPAAVMDLAPLRAALARFDLEALASKTKPSADAPR